MDATQIQGAGLALSLVSKLVYEEPDEDVIRNLIREDVFEEVPFGEDDEAVAGGAALLRAWCQEHREDDPERFGLSIRDLKSDWFMLFIGPSIPHAPSWAGYYLSPKSEMFSLVTLEVRKIYRSWGYEPDGINKEPEDFLSIMLGFISALIEREGDEADSVEAAAKTQQLLLSKYILPWITLWDWAVAKYAKTDFYRGLGRLVLGLCRAYSARFGIAFIEDGKNSRFFFEKR